MVTTTSLRRKRISFRYLAGHPARLLAFGFGIGLFPRGPGTVASLLMIPLYNYLATKMGSTALLILFGVMFAAGIWICERTGRDIGIEDHGGIVWDEMTAMLLVLVFVPATPLAQVLAFGLFRLFDIFKPGPVRYTEIWIRGGLGVMADDIVAGFLALVCMTLWTLLFGRIG